MFSHRCAKICRGINFHLPGKFMHCTGTYGLSVPSADWVASRGMLQPAVLSCITDTTHSQAGKESHQEACTGPLLFCFKKVVYFLHGRRCFPIFWTSVRYTPIQMRCVCSNADANRYKVAPLHRYNLFNTKLCIDFDGPIQFEHDYQLVYSLQPEI